MWGQEEPTGEKIIKLCIIVLGVVLASAGEIHFSMAGFVFQLGGLIFESLRAVMTKELMIESGPNLDPLVSLYYYAPFCAVANLLVAIGAEWHTFQWSNISNVGFGVLTLNACVAFLLNVASVMLVSPMHLFDDIFIDPGRLAKLERLSSKFVES